ncbi:TetR/AcrR family transcriptional regulator [Mycobacterium fragae]|uniref:HTH tetR-type domain-containing protein n=1 Tax=Mycobacterium fragae TaxID=1260918 RepID=A0A1X1UM40_9MYCO|nr:TetR/AcrR family transcriptional regulator [Mycobacterium fragae]ORV57900.1 hypothetical protein AWC06_21435 [Mycobacterium fragae]
MVDVRSSARESLLSAAAELTYERGITATGVDAIVNAAGVTKRTLYQHFGSKDALVAASLEARDAAAIQSLRAAAQKRAKRTGEPVILALFDVIDTVLSSSATAGCAFLNAALEIGGPEHPVRQAALHHLRSRERLVGEMLAQSGCATEDLTAQISLLVDGAFAVAGSGRDPRAARRAKDAARALLAGATR